ncbi:hypothetical protein pipiens_018252, partial [Culex pipiens pipiens]
MSRAVRVNYKPEPRKRKQREQDENGGENTEPLRQAMTAAERMRRYRKRKKMKEQETRVDLVREDTATVGTPRENREPIPGRSTDPPRFYSHPDPAQMSMMPTRATAEAGLTAIRVAADERKKMKKQETRVDSARESTATVGTPREDREPIPCRSTDPPRFYSHPDPVQMSMRPTRATAEAGLTTTRVAGDAVLPNLEPMPVRCTDQVQFIPAQLPVSPARAIGQVGSAVIR